MLNSRRPFFNRRRQINRCVFRDRAHPLDMYDDTELVRRHRFITELIMDLCDQIGPDIEPASNRNHAIPAILQIFCALRYYACGTFQHVVGDSIRIHRSSVSLIIHRVSRRICTLYRQYISFPDTRQEAQDFRQQHCAMK